MVRGAVSLAWLGLAWCGKLCSSNGLRLRLREGLAALAFWSCVGMVGWSSLGSFVLQTQAVLRLAREGNVNGRAGGRCECYSAAVSLLLTVLVVLGVCLAMVW